MTDPTIRILYVDTCVGLAGGQFSLIEILKSLDAKRFVPTVCSPARSRLRTKCKELGVQWRPLPFESAHVSTQARSRAVAAFKHILCSLYGVFFLIKEVRKNRIDLVHANTFKAGLVGGVACLLSQKPMIFHDRTRITHGFLGWIVALLAKRIIAISQTVIAKHPAIFRHKITLIPPGVDTDYLNPREITEPGKTICYLGRISDEKGLHSLVECAPLVLKRIPDARLVIGGIPFTEKDVGYLEGIKRRIAELRLGSRLEFLGYVDDIRGLLEKIDVLVLPSEREAVGRVMLEAMALEKPVVAFDVDGPREVISNKRNGILVRLGDLRGFAHAIASLLEDRQMALGLGRNGRQLVVERFSSRSVAESIMQVYDGICQGRPEPGKAPGSLKESG